MKKMSICFTVFTIIAMATIAYAQCADVEDCQVKVIRINAETAGDQMVWTANADDCCGGETCGSMGQGCSSMKGMGHHGKGNCGHGCFLCCAKALELSDTQVSKLKAMKMDAKKAAIRNQAELDILNLELKDMLHDMDVSRSAIDGKLDKVGGLKAKMATSKVRTLLDARDVLSKEQLEKCMGGMCGCGDGMGMMKVMKKHKAMGSTCTCEGGKCTGECSSKETSCSGSSCSGSCSGEKK